MTMNKRGELMEMRKQMLEQMLPKLMMMVEEEMKLH